MVHHQASPWRPSPGLAVARQSLPRCRSPRPAKLTGRLWRKMSLLSSSLDFGLSDQKPDQAENTDLGQKPPETAVSLTSSLHLRFHIGIAVI